MLLCTLHFLTLFLQKRFTVLYKKLPGHKRYSQVPYMLIIGSGNGLVCLFYYLNPFNIRIWNPSTRKIMDLPRCDYLKMLESIFLFGLDFVSNLMTIIGNLYKMGIIFSTIRGSCLQLEHKFMERDYNRKFR